MRKRTTIRLPTTWENNPISANYDNWICPNIRTYWKLLQSPKSDQVILSTLEGNHQHLFSSAEGYALRYFTGEFTVQQVQQACQQKLTDAVTPYLVAQLLQKLITLEIITSKETPEELAEPKNQEKLPIPNRSSSPLKTCLQWIAHPDGYWLLRNPENVTFLQVSDRDKVIIEQLGMRSLSAIAQEFSVTQDELRQLLQKLAATGMLTGTHPAKPRRGKFTPLQLLFFRIPLFNPDPWLTRHVDKLRWIWTKPFAFNLCLFLAFSTVLALDKQQEIISIGQQLLTYQAASLLLPFILLTALVVTLHELGHAFTLKHYGGIVPEVGLLLMLLIPAAYTNTTDSYCLSRFKRVLVVGAGVLVQLIVAAIAFWLWHLSATDTWLNTGSYLLMVAALFTIALNLNPLARFDGYYLAVAFTGINNLRRRSFGFYANLLRLQPIRERARDAWILAIYAPFSLAYILLVFGFLLGRILNWSLTNIPYWTLTLLAIWAIYYYFPSSVTSKTVPSQASPLMKANHSNSRPSLKVVPPSEQPTPSTPPQSRETTSTPSPTSNQFPLRWIVLGIVAGAIGIVSFIPTPYEVGGFVELETQEGAREVIHTPIAAVVSEVHVQSGQRVKPGQLLAQLSSWELKEQIAQEEKQLIQARQQLEAAHKQRIRAQGQLMQSQALGKQLQQKAQRYNNRAAMLEQGQLPPEIQKLEVERQRLEARLPEIAERIRRHEVVVKEGAVSQDRLDSVREEFRDTQSQLAAKNEAIKAAKQNLTDSAIDSHAEAKSQAAAIDAAQQIAEAEAEIRLQEEAITTIKKHLQQLLASQKELTLKAPLNGTVLTSNLDLKKNRELKPDSEPLMEIADLTQLVATVKVREDDLEYVKIDKPVTFRARQRKLEPYDATVKSIKPLIKPDDANPANQRRVALVQLIVDNTDGQLKPGATGYAKIWSEEMFLYQRLGRELVRLVPERFLPGNNRNNL